MRLRDLLQEGPVFLPPEQSETVEDEKGTYISAKTAKRDYIKIGVFPLIIPIGKHNFIDILIGKSAKSVIGVIPSKRPIGGDDGYKDVFFLMFKDELPIYLPEELDHDKVVQVDGVATHKEIRGRGLATFVYFTLVAHGYTIISDFYHEYGGLKLWRKLSKTAGLNDYVINILDHGIFVKDDQGNILNFNDGNYSKSKIWSTTPDYKNKNVLLVMRSTV